MSTTTERDAFRECDVPTLIGQVGRNNILAISGGRVIANSAGTGIILPVSSGYSVTIDLDANDTYVVRRMFKRKGTVAPWVMGERRNVYCGDVGQIAYMASCYRNVAF